MATTAGRTGARTSPPNTLRGGMPLVQRTVCYRTILDRKT